MADFTVVLTPEGGVGDFYTPNLPDEDFRRVLARTPNDRSPLTMRVKLVEIHHGEMVHERKPYEATLLVLEFRFQSQLQSRRYQSVKVTLEFLDKASPGSAKRDPVIVGLAPDRMHWLNKTSFDKTTKYGASVSATLGIEPASLEASTNWEVERSEPVNFKATLTAIPGQSKGKLGQDENAVTWTMEENQHEGEGIPSFLQTAVLLQRHHSGPFTAQLRVQSKVDTVSVGYRALPKTTDRDKIIDPITIRPGEIQVQNNSITGIQEKDLACMDALNISTCFAVNLSEQDPLLPPRTLSSGVPEPTPEPLQSPPPPLHYLAQARATEPITATSAAMDVAYGAARAAETAARAALKAAEAAEAAAKAASLAAEAAKAVAGVAETIARGLRAVGGGSIHSSSEKAWSA